MAIKKRNWNICKFRKQLLTRDEQKQLKFVTHPWMCINADQCRPLRIYADQCGSMLIKQNWYQCSSMQINADQCRSMRIYANQCGSLRINADQCQSSHLWSNNDQHWSALISIDLYWVKLIFIDRNWSAMIFIGINSWNLIFIDRHWTAFGIDPACPGIISPASRSIITLCRYVQTVLDAVSLNTLAQLANDSPILIISRC